MRAYLPHCAFTLATTAIVIWPSIRYPYEWAFHNALFTLASGLLFWIGHRHGRASVSIILVPLTWFGAISPVTLISLAPFDACLAAGSLVIYTLVMADAASLRSIETDAGIEWSPVASPRKLSPALLRVPLVVGIFLACVCPVAFPEALVPSGHRWSHYTPRVQCLATLVIGIMGALYINRIGRPRVSFRRTNRALWIALIILGTGGGVALDGL